LGLWRTLTRRKLLNVTLGSFERSSKTGGFLPIKIVFEAEIVELIKSFDFVVRKLEGFLFLLFLFVA
jgi:hypothetical protein